MTNPRPQSQLGPVVGTPLLDGFLKIKVYDETALKVKNLKPVPTVWSWKNGRPIYQRLPANSQGYQLDFYGDPSEAFVLIGRNDAASGPGSLQVGAWDRDQAVLVIQSGTLTWQYGQVVVNGYAVNLSTLGEGLGLQDGDYQVGYYLNYEAPENPEFQLFTVEDTPLSDSACVYAGSSSALDFPFESVFTEDDTDSSWRPNSLGTAGGYRTGSWLTLDFTEEVKSTKFVFTAPEGIKPTAPCAAYSSPDAIVWTLETEVKPLGNAWTVNAPSDLPRRYWRFFFWDGLVDIESLSYTGEALFPNLRPLGPVSTATPFIEDRYEELEGPAAVLALITVRNNAIEAVADVRRTSSKKYEPVAKWLTAFQDEAITKTFRDVENYAERFLAPPTSSYTLYDDLLEDFSFSLGSEVDNPRVLFPSEVALKDPTYLNTNPTIQVFPGLRELTADGSPITDFEIEAENVLSLQSGSTVTPKEIIFLKDPSDLGDLATKAYADGTLIVNMDNGIFN